MIVLQKLADTPTDFNGSIFVVEPIVVNVLNKLPVGVLEIKLEIGIDYGHNQDPNNPQQYPVSYRLENTRCMLKYGNIPLSHTFTNSGQIEPNIVKTEGYTLRISTEDIREIESKRVDDLTLGFFLEGTYQPHRLSSTQSVGPSKEFSLYVPWKFSQKEWVQFLTNLGYSERWIVEIDRPKLEGFHEVLEFVEKAQKGVAEGAAPDAIISDLRSAWDRLDPYIREFDSELKTAIESGSKGEPDKPNKDKRVEEIADWNKAFLEVLTELRKATDKFTQIGPHKEFYVSTKDDALLALRLTVSLMAYYSRLLSTIERDMKERRKKV